MLAKKWCAIFTIKIFSRFRRSWSGRKNWQEIRRQIIFTKSNEGNIKRDSPAPCFNKSMVELVGVASSKASSFGSVHKKVRHEDKKDSQWLRKINKNGIYWEEVSTTGHRNWVTIVFSPLVGIISLHGRARGVMACWYTRADRHPVNTYTHKWQAIAHKQADGWHTIDCNSKGINLSQYNKQQTENHKSITTENLFLPK